MALAAANRHMNLAESLANNNKQKGQQEDADMEAVDLALPVDALKQDNRIDEEDKQYLKGQQDDEQKPVIKCSAVHTLERDMPDFDYSHLVTRLRELVLEDHEKNPGIYSHKDIELLKADDWMVARYLLRHKCDITLAFDMIRRALRFKNESICNGIRREDFPSEFFKLGGLFTYEPDRKGNVMLYIRVKLHRRVSEIQTVLQAFFYHTLMRADELARGRGMSIVFDCSGGGIVNADMDTLMFVFSTLNNYFPKGLSYLLVHEMPWILKPFWHIAKAWIPEEKRELIKFSDSRTIYEYVDKENLPDFMGGTCERDYRQLPENCTTLEQAIKLWGIEKSVAKKTLLKFAEFLPPESLEALNALENSDDDDRASDASMEPQNNATHNDSDQENKP